MGDAKKSMRVLDGSHINLEVNPNTLLGNGSFGLVIKTKYLGTYVAAKTLHMLTNPMMYGLFLGTPEYEYVIREFQLELETTANLCHPNIIQVIGVINGNDNTPRWIISELGDTTLEEEFEKRIINHKSLKEKLEILIDILRGLTFMHANQIVHRDLKPANVIKVKQTYKLCDLGLLKIFINKMM
jgi:serine/threonine protein kinase